ncbi:MAG: GHKL domain-containing protein [Clostridiales bacterium]|nr:GHKL domain-containing protein [Clostridiales bacterium]
MAEAEQKGIPFLLDVKLPETLAVDQRLLCSLLCNLLDNALEASERTQRPDISFSMRLSKGYLSIQCKNRIDGSVLQSNPTLRTSKPDSFSHGIGLRLIRQAVDRCDGDLRIREEGGYFSVRILLPDRAEG